MSRCEYFFIQSVVLVSLLLPNSGIAVVQLKLPIINAQRRRGSFVCIDIMCIVYSLNVCTYAVFMLELNTEK